MARDVILSPEQTNQLDSPSEFLENSLAVVDDRLEEDFDEARDTIKNVMGKMESVADTAVTIATETGEPRAVEVANQALKNLLDASKRLLEVHEKKTAMKALNLRVNQESGEAPGSVTNNQQFIFNGSTKDLMDFLENKKIIDQ